MALKVSQLMGMDIYTDGAQHLGKVYDVIIDLQSGELVRLTLEPIKATSKDEARKIFKDKTIMFRSVKAVSNIVLVSNEPVTDLDEEPESPALEKPKPYSYKYKRSFGK